MNPHLDFLLSTLYDDLLAEEHAADLRKSGLTDETIRAQKIRTIPPGMIDQILGFPMPSVTSAYLFPFADPAGGWMDYVKMKIFAVGEPTDLRGDKVEERRERWRYNGGQRKYLVRRRAAPRLYFPIATMRRALEGDEGVWLVEGMKKALAVAQVGLPAVAIESAWSWHVKGSRDLLPDFDAITLSRRIVKVVPDPDAQTSPEIARAMHRLAEALERRGARVQLVRLPVEVAV